MKHHASPDFWVCYQSLPRNVRKLADLHGAFAVMAQERVNCFLAMASPLTRSQRALLAERSLKHRIAGMFGITIPQSVLLRADKVIE